MSGVFVSSVTSTGVQKTLAQVEFGNLDCALSLVWENHCMNGAAWSCVISPGRSQWHDLKHKPCLMVSNIASKDFQMLGNEHLFISHRP